MSVQQWLASIRVGIDELARGGPGEGRGASEGHKKDNDGHKDSSVADSLGLVQRGQARGQD